MTVHEDDEFEVLVPEALDCQYQLTPEGGVPLNDNTDCPQSLLTVGVFGVDGIVYGPAVPEELEELHRPVSFDLALRYCVLAEYTVIEEDELEVLVPLDEVCQYQLVPDGGDPLKLSTDCPHELLTAGVEGVPGSGAPVW